MAQLDRAKEIVAYEKFWQGIVVVTDISLTGWLVSAWEAAAATMVLLAFVGVSFLTLTIVILHRRITHGIELLGQL